MRAAVGLVSATRRSTLRGEGERVFVGVFVSFSATSGDSDLSKNRKNQKQNWATCLSDVDKYMLLLCAVICVEKKQEKLLRTELANYLGNVDKMYTCMNTYKCICVYVCRYIYVYIYMYV